MSTHTKRIGDEKDKKTIILLLVTYLAFCLRQKGKRKRCLLFQTPLWAVLFGHERLQSRVSEISIFRLKKGDDIFVIWTFALLPWAKVCLRGSALYVNNQRNALRNLVSKSLPDSRSFQVQILIHCANNITRGSVYSAT